jgi:hypothetical protein
MKGLTVWQPWAICEIFIDRKIRRLAKEYGMSESDVRQMLAFDRSTTKGDVVEVDTPISQSTGEAKPSTVDPGTCGQ